MSKSAIIYREHVSRCACTCHDYDEVGTEPTFLNGTTSCCYSEEEAEVFNAPENYPVPAGKQRRDGVEYGCGSAECADCYEAATVAVQS